MTAEPDKTITTGGKTDNSLSNTVPTKKRVDNFDRLKGAALQEVREGREGTARL